MITDPNEPYYIQARDRRLWIWGEVRAKYVELARRRRQSLKDGLFFLGLLVLHVGLMLLYGLWFKHLIRALGPYWMGVTLGQGVSMCVVRWWVCRQRWWQVR